MKPIPLITSGPFQGYGLHRYRAALVDVPWHFATRSPKGDGRSPSAHYNTMSIEQIMALPVRQLFHKDCIMFFWIIDTHVPQSLEIIKAWGFSYKTTGLYWVKTNKDGTIFNGMGFWTRANPEHAAECYNGDDQEAQRLFLATMGKPKRQAKNVSRVIMAPRREHSRKPDETHERIEALVDGPYIELFARNKRPGWTSWGNETDKFVDALRRDEMVEFL